LAEEVPGETAGVLELLDLNRETARPQGV